MSEAPVPKRKRPPRIMDKGWRERHIQGQADGTLPPGEIQLRHADGSLAFDRLGRPRKWSQYVQDATQPSRGPRHSKEVAAAIRARLQAEAAED